MINVSKENLTIPLKGQSMRPGTYIIFRYLQWIFNAIVYEVGTDPEEEEIELIYMNLYQDTLCVHNCTMRWQEIEHNFDDCILNDISCEQGHALIGKHQGMYHLSYRVMRVDNLPQVAKALEGQAAINEIHIIDLTEALS